MEAEEKFRQAERAPDGGWLLVGADHPVDLFVGLDGGRRALMARCPGMPPEPPRMAALTVQRHMHPSGTWALIVRLERRDLAALFNVLAADLVAATARVTPPDLARTLVTRLFHWQKLLARAPAGVLEDPALRGLLAELAFLREGIDAVGARVAVQAWRGPTDAPKDFAFDTFEVEVKSIHRDQTELSISSLEQLSDAGLDLYLHTRVVELVAGAGSGTSSVGEYIREIRRALEVEPDVAEELDARLALVGYAENPEYENRWVRFGGGHSYRVDEAFPRLQRQSTPAAITSCSYQIATARLPMPLPGTWPQEALR